MRKTAAVTAATGALLFGAAGVAHATVQNVPAPSSTTTTLAQENPNDDNGDNNGLWGLLGLLGLGGLMGMKRRDDDHRGMSTAGGAGGTYRGTGTDTGRV